MRRKIRQWCVAFLVASGLLTLLTGSLGFANSAQAQHPELHCSISIEIEETRMWVNVAPDPSISFVAPPSYRFVVQDINGSEVASGGRSTNDPGRVSINTQRLLSGTYTVSGESAGGSGGTCETTVMLPGDAAPEQNDPPDVSVDCGVLTSYFVGDTVTVTANAVDPDGEIKNVFWELPSGAFEAGFTAEFEFSELGQNSFQFTAVDDDDADRSAQCEFTVFEKQNTPSPSATPEPPPTPTSTPTPQPSATPEPEPSATPQPQPSSTPTPSPQPAPTPTPDSEEEAAPDEDPVALNPGADEPDGSDGDTNVIPGVLEANWREPMIVGQTTKFVVILDGTDWTPRAEEIRANAVIADTDDDGNRVYQVAIYGAVGDIDLRIDVDSELLRLVNPFGDEPPSAVETVRLQPFIRDEAIWYLEPTDAGTAEVRIRVLGVEKATPPNPPKSPEELALIKVEDLNLDLAIEVQTEERESWLAFKWWHGLGPLLLPWIPIASLGLFPRRPSPGGATRPIINTSTTTSGGTVGLIFSGGGLRASAFSLGAAMYVADIGAWQHIRHIASVSGGSLTNAFVGRRVDELGRSPHSGDEFSQLMHRISHDGLPLERAAKLFGAVVALGSLWIGTVLNWAAPTWWETAVWTLTASALFAAVSWLALGWLGVRPALRRWIPDTIGIDPDLALSALGSGASVERSHVFTSTTTRSNHAHFAPANMFVTSPRGSKHVPEDQRPNAQIEFEGSPKDITVADVVQASAAFPGLPRVVLTPSDVGLDSYDQRNLALRDGGTLDNLGHIEQTLLAHQSRDLQNFLTDYGAVQQWLVVDSSKYRDRPPRVSSVLMRIVEALNLGVAFDVAEMAGSEPQRRTAESANEVRHHFRSNPRLGVLLDLRQSPVELCREILAEAGATGAADAMFRDGRFPANYRPSTQREYAAATALALLVAARPGAGLETYWRQRSVASNNVATTLSSLGKPTTIALVHHGYALAATLAHLELGWPLPEAHQLSEARFVAMSVNPPVMSEPTAEFEPQLDGQSG